MGTLNAVLDELADHSAWADIQRTRLAPLFERARLVEVESDETLFQQYHPAKAFYFLAAGELQHHGAAGLPGDTLAFGPTSHAFAPVGWSGFLTPQRYGTTVVASADATLIGWDQEVLAECFYQDPELAVRFFDLVLAGVTRQVVALRERRVDELGLSYASKPVPVDPGRLPLVGSAQATLRRSAFFARFDEAAIARLAEHAEPLPFGAGDDICAQDADLGGLLVLARGRAELTFDAAERRLPFRTMERQIGVIGGLPAAARTYIAEASVTAQSSCWAYRLPVPALRAQFADDPEFGRVFQQRQLARLSSLLAALRVVSNRQTADPEAAAVASLIANRQTRLPVTSALYRVPHLLANKLTLANAFATLATVNATGRYDERLVAGQCQSLTRTLAAEHAFFQTILETCETVISAPETESSAAIRNACDQRVGEAFDCLETEITGSNHLPDSPGHVFVLNHLACPAYYELPNRYHFSFDTAFVAMLLFRHYGNSALRVIRESPDAEFGHNLFYRRLGHLTVPTVESGLETLSEQQLAAERRAAGQRFIDSAAAALAAGINVVICPEGQSQPVERSPAHFHSGAFRLASAAGAWVVPVCLAGFHRRFKDGPLLAEILPPLAAEDAAGTPRQLADECRRRMADTLPSLLAASERAARMPEPPAA